MAAATRSKHHGAVHLQEPVDSKASPIAGKVQSLPMGGATQKTDPGFEEDVAIDEFIGHRVDTKNSTVDIHVKWQDGETTWESEWSLQEKVPSLVFKYWEKLNGRYAATNLDTYHVFKILKRALASLLSHDVAPVEYQGSSGPMKSLT